MKQYLKLLLIILPLLGGAGAGYAKKPAHALPLAGQAAIDSMLQKLSKKKEDTDKVKLLNNISFTCCAFNPDNGLKYGQKALELAAKLGWEKGIAMANSNLGNNYQNKSEYSKALDYFSQALKTDQETGDKQGVVMVTANIGFVYQSQSDYLKALEYYFKDLKMAEEIGDKNSIAAITRGIGFAYYSKNDFPKAQEFYFKALKIEEELGDKTGIARVNGNIGEIYSEENETTMALEYYFKALKADEETGDEKDIEITTADIGNIYADQNDYPKALEYYFKALKTAEEIGDKDGFATSTGNIGDAYTHQRNYTMAIDYLQRSLKIAGEVGNKYLMAGDLGNIGACFLSIIWDTSHKSNTRQPNEPASADYVPGNTIPAGKAALLRSAIDYLQRCIVVCKEIHVLDPLQDGYQNLSEAYRMSGDYKRALECADNYRAIKDSVFSKANNELILKMGIKNEYYNKRLADSLKAAAKEKITALRLQRQRGYTYMGVAGILLLAGFSYFIIKERGKSEKERKKSDELLLNILPAEVADELKANGNTKAKQYDNVTVLFTDFVNFMSVEDMMAPQALIDELDTCFRVFDEITGKYKIEKIKTIGDAYLAVAGLPAADPKHAENAVSAAIEINTFMQDRLAKLGQRTFEVRIGIHSGSVVAGIVGVKKFAYDIWGDAVNTAARIVQSGESGKINISPATYELVKDKFNCEYRGEIPAKNKGLVKMYFVS